ncbi:hypothetical protein CD798_14345 [Bacillaceae bacterium SAOS 7]|nr:hypothetical protein CD798_14345 [Bacillaceae bacterium SAOS 7]
MFTYGDNEKDARKSAKEILEMMVEFAAEKSITLPEPTPIDQIDIRQENIRKSPSLSVLPSNISQHS